MTSKHRKQKSSEDVLELRDLDAQRIRALVIAAVALIGLMYAMTLMAESLNTSLDQQEDLAERLEKATERPDARGSGSELPKT